METTKTFHWSSIRALNHFAILSFLSNWRRKFRKNGSPIICVNSVMERNGIVVSKEGGQKRIAGVSSWGWSMAGTFAPSVSSLQMHLCSFPLLICLGCGKLVLHILFLSKMVQLEHFVCSFLFVTCWHLSSRALICSSYNNPVVNWLISFSWV